MKEAGSKKACREKGQHTVKYWIKNINEPRNRGTMLYCNYDNSRQAPGEKDYATIWEEAGKVRKLDFSNFCIRMVKLIKSIPFILMYNTYMYYTLN